LIETYKIVSGKFDIAVPNLTTPIILTIGGNDLRLQENSYKI